MSESTSAARGDQPQRQTSAGRKCRVLIIEDDAAIAAAVRAILTRKGCDVCVAGTLHQGLKALDDKPNYVILDLMLPDGDGVEILRKLRDQKNTARVMITTAVRDENRLRALQEFQTHRLLRKPIDLVDLLNAIGMM